MNTELEFNFVEPTGDDLKREGMERVKSHATEWWGKAVDYYRSWIARWPVGWQFTGEDFRFDAAKAIGNPHHPNVWGSFTGKVIAVHCRKTGRMVKPRDRNSRARPIPMYQKV